MRLTKLSLLIQCVIFYGAFIAPNAALAGSQNLYDIYLEAKQNDPVLASATSANLAAQELIEQAKAAYRPSVNLTASATTTRSDVKIIGSSNVLRGGKNAYDGYSATVQARQPIYRKENLARIDQSEAQVSQSDKQLHLAQQDLMNRTTKAYFDVLLAQDKIALIDAQKAAILSQLDQAKATFQVGTATITDVNEAQARYDLILAQEISAKNDFDIAKRALQVLTGKMPDQLATVKPDLKVGQLKQSIQEWQEVAKHSNLNIQIQEDALKISDQDIEIAQSGHYPTLDAVANHTNAYSNGGQNGFGNDSQISSLGLELAIPLYQGGGTSSRVRQAALNRQKAQDDLLIAQRQTDLDTQRAYLNLNTSIAQVKALEQALISSQSQLDSTKLGYEVGVRTSVDVLNAQQQLFSAKRDLLQARYNYLINIIALKSASGIVAEADIQDINQHLMAQIATKKTK